jgi:hypothetical protein
VQPLPSVLTTTCSGFNNYINLTVNFAGRERLEQLMGIKSITVRHVHHPVVPMLQQQATDTEMDGKCQDSNGRRSLCPSGGFDSDYIGYL